MLKPHDDMGGGGMPSGDGQGGVIHIPKDMFPPGMAEKIKHGDVIEFRAIGPADAEGDVPVEYNTGEPEEKTPPWEDEFREHMSPNSGGAGGGAMGSDDAGGMGY